MKTCGSARVVFFSNGHGEDAIAGRLIDRVCRRTPALLISAWPMIGEGYAYERRGVARVGSPNRVPSEGFGTLSATWLYRDVRAGVLGNYRRQWVAARRLRGQFDLAVAVGDIVPVLAARRADVPWLFVGCAKSSRYGWRGRYNRTELRLFRHRCLGAFPRDAETARVMVHAGIAARHVGNPMMDDLEPTGPLDIPEGRIVVAMLPGSRADAARNVLRLVSLARAAAAGLANADRPHWACAPASEFDLRAFLDGVHRSSDRSLSVVESASGSAAGVGVRLTDPEGTVIDVLPGRFVDAVDRAALVVGMAGTANEQALGLGRPLLALPASGPCGIPFVRMKVRLFGDAAVTIETGEAEAARAIIELLGDPARRSRMAEAGRRRMGPPGASDTIADAICAAAGSLAR